MVASISKVCTCTRVVVVVCTNIVAVVIDGFGFAVVALKLVVFVFCSYVINECIFIVVVIIRVFKILIIVVVLLFSRL